METRNKWRMEMAAGGAFLKERLDGLTVPISGSIEQEEADKKLKEWSKKAGGSGGQKAFEMRLSVENITMNEARLALAPCTWNYEQPLPEWVAEVEKIFALFPCTEEELSGKMYFDPKLEDTSINSFVGSLYPFLYYGEERLQAKLGSRKVLFSNKALSNMSGILFRQLTFLCGKVIMNEFGQYIAVHNPLISLFGGVFSPEQKKEISKDFSHKTLQGKWTEVLTKYPVLARLIVISIDHWVENMTELAYHLDNDKKELECLFNEKRDLGSVTGIKGEISDSHNHGKTVLILEFERLKIVYKPRSLAVDQAWEYLIKWLNDQGVKDFLKAPRVLNKKNYGWVEYIEHHPLAKKEDINSFYYRAGGLMAIITTLGGNDFHLENMIAWGSYPVLVDLETLFAHRVKPFQLDELGLNANQKAQDFLSDSVLNIGFLPLWKKEANHKVRDMGALTGEKKGTSNLPVFNGKAYNGSPYVDDIMKGFEKVYDVLQNKKEELLGQNSPFRTFSECKFRFLIRTSQVYGDVLSHIVLPKYLKSGFDYSVEIERLAPAYLLHASCDKLKQLWDIFLSERDALQRRDLPIFYGAADKLGLFDGCKELDHEFFMQTAIDRAEEKIAGLNEQDKKVQLELIQTSMSMYEDDTHKEKSAKTMFSSKLTELPSLDKEKMLQEADNIYRYIMEKRITGVSDDFTWIVRQSDLQTGKMVLGKISISMYDGVLGMGVFFAALYRCKKNPEIKEAAMSIARLVRQSLYDGDISYYIQRLPLGLGSGLGGIITSLVLMSEFLHDDSILADAFQIVDKIMLDQVKKDENLDVLGGCAGLLFALDRFLKILKRKGQENDHILELALACGDHLMEKRVNASSGHRVWDTGIGVAPLTGLGHGTAGIAYALLKLFDLTKEESYYLAACEALEYESGLYDEEHNNWPDLRKIPDLKPGEKAFMAGWCAGAPGIGLARLGSLSVLDKPTVRQDIERAVNFVFKCPLNASDHLCCGNSGRIDLLIEASERLEKPELLSEAQKRIWWMIQRKKEVGHFVFHGEIGNVVFDPSLFQGLSGVGYEILRCLHPEKIPSLLI